MSVINMSQNLYEYFNCADKNELYKKIKDKDHSVSELLEYLNYVKTGNKELNIEKINSSTSLEKYLKNGNMPDKNEISIIIVDSANHILKDFKGKDSLEIKEFIENTHTYTGKAFILISNSKDYLKVKEISSTLDTLGLIELEVLEKNYNNGPSYLNISNRIANEELIEKVFSEQSYINNKRESLIDYQTKNNEITNLSDYEEFINHFTKAELKNLSVIDKKDMENFHKILGARNAHLTQEFFSVIQFNDEYKIIDYETIAKGASDKTTIDIKIVAGKVIDKNTSGIIILHNHPSGNLKPSSSDIEITKEINKICNLFNKTLLDHIIYNKDNTGYFSFRENEIIEDDLRKIIDELEQCKDIKVTKIEVDKVYAFHKENIIRVADNKEENFMRLIDDIMEISEKNSKDTQVFCINKNNESFLINDFPKKLNKELEKYEGTYKEFCEKVYKDFLSKFSKRNNEKLLEEINLRNLKFTDEIDLKLLKINKIPKKKKTKEEKER